MNRKAILARLAAIKTEAKAVLDAADKDGAGKLSAEQEKQFDALMAEKDTLEANLKRLDSLESMDQSAGRVTQPVTPAKAKATKGIEVGGDVIEQDEMRGFESAADFGRAVRLAGMPGHGVDQRLVHLHREAVRDNAAHGDIVAAPTDFHRETSSADGYMVPPAVRQNIWSNVFDGEGILDAVSPEPTESNSVQLFADESTPWGATGVQAKWASEGSQFDPSRLSTKARTVQLHKLYAFVLATDELVSDAPRLNERLTKGAAAAIRYKAEDAIIDGDGAGKPLGWMNGGCLVTVAKEGGQAADTIVEENVLKMYARLLASGSQGAFWLAHKSTLPQLAVMTIGDQPAFLPMASGLTEAPRSRLLGMPIVWSEHAEVVGDLGDIQLVAPRGYYAAVKQGGPKFAASIHLYFDYDIEAFRWTFRLGGQPMLSAAVSPAKGSDTLSHFIALAARA